MNLSYLSQIPYAAQQTYEPYNSHLAFDGSASQSQLLDSQAPPGQNHVPHPFGPFPVPRIANRNDVESASNAQTVPAVSMGPPTKSRKRKAPTLRAEAWEPYKARIIELHITEKRPLPEVKQIIEQEFGFTAEIRQYRTRISQWGKDKNVKPEEMRAIVRKRQRRKLTEVEKPELATTVRGNIVEPQKIDRWMKRNNVPESFLYAPSPAASTPSDVYCWTISERGSPVPNPAYSPAALALSPGGTTSVAQSPQLFSPALSVLSIIRPQRSTFTGQSPALANRPLPSSSLQPVPTASVLQCQSNSTTSAVQYRYRQADEETLREELASAEILFESGHSMTLGILSELGTVLMEQGRYKSAEDVIRRLVDSRQAEGGARDVSTLEALELLGQVLGLQGLYSKAEKLHRQTFNSRRAILGAEHPDTLSSMGNLALIYRNQGRYKEAEELEVQVMETSQRVLGKEHPDTLTSMGNLALTYWKQGRCKEAEELEVQVMETRQRVLGKEHPDTLISMGNLALIYWKQGRWKEAEELEVQVMEISQRVLGKEHPDTLISMRNLASGYRKQGRWKEAEELEAQVNKIG